MKNRIRLIVFCLLAALLLSGCTEGGGTPSGTTEPSKTAETTVPATEPATTAVEPVTEPATEPFTAEPTTAEPVTEPATSEPATEPLSPVTYDPDTRTWYVTGTDDYESLVFPAADNPGLLQVDDDDFTICFRWNRCKAHGFRQVFK